MFKKVLSMPLRAKVAAGTALTTVGSAALPVVAFAAEGDVSTGVGYAVSAVTGLSSMFTMYPMNIFLGCSVAIMGFKVFRSGKRSTK